MRFPTASSSENKPTRFIGSGSASDGKDAFRSTTHRVGSNETFRKCRLTRADLNRSDLTGMCLGAYDLGVQIGRGGMGQVFRALHRHLRRDVAIKFVQADGIFNSEIHARFMEEVQAVGQLQNQHIVQANDAGVIDGVQYLVTELLIGSDLGSLIEQKGPVPLPIAIEIIRQTSLGLAHAHRLGFVHRDIKPSNLFFTDEGQVKILDFGLVRQLKNASDLTAHGNFMGTMDYIAPEQAENARQATPQSDIYSLGCTLIYLLTGQPPYPDSTHPTPVMKLRGHFSDEVSWEQRAQSAIPKEVSRLVNRMISKNLSQRFATCEEVVEALAKTSKPLDLRNWLSEKPNPSRSRLTESGFKPLVSLNANHNFSSIRVASLFVLTLAAAISLLVNSRLPAVSMEAPPSNVNAVASEKTTMQQQLSKKETEPVPPIPTPEPMTKSEATVVKDAQISRFAIPVGRGVIRSTTSKTPKAQVQ